MTVVIKWLFVLLYRRMPWYSTTTNPQVAIHMQIRGGGVNNNGLLSPVSAGMGQPTPPLPGLPKVVEEEEDEDSKAVNGCNGAAVVGTVTASPVPSPAEKSSKARFRLKKSASVAMK